MQFPFTSHVLPDTRLKAGPPGSEVMTGAGSKLVPGTVHVSEAQLQVLAQ